jgi:hypothetical protein
MAAIIPGAERFFSFGMQPFAKGGFLAYKPRFWPLRNSNLRVAHRVAGRGEVSIT